MAFMSLPNIVKLGLLLLQILGPLEENDTEGQTAITPQNEGEENAEISAEENTETSVDGMEVQSTSTELDLQTALSDKLKLRQQLIKTEHHLKFLVKCTEQRKPPKGLKTNNNVRLAETPHSIDTMATIRNIYHKAEHDVCKALIGHHKKSQLGTSKKLKLVDSSIDQHLQHNTENLTPIVLQFQLRRS